MEITIEQAVEIINNIPGYAAAALSTKDENPINFIRVYDDDGDGLFNMTMDEFTSISKMVDRILKESQTYWMNRGANNLRHQFRKLMEV